jgi:predicted lysophospholipase L1 biosynthesis ABC-type transport system permease subunit
MMIAVTLLPLILVAAIAALAVLHRDFEDNLLQRIGLSGICVGAVLSIAVTLEAHGAGYKTYIVLIYGLAFYAVGTFIKFKRHHRI